MNDRRWLMGAKLTFQRFAFTLSTKQQHESNNKSICVLVFLSPLDNVNIGCSIATHALTKQWYILSCPELEPKRRLQADSIHWEECCSSVTISLLSKAWHTLFSLSFPKTCALPLPTWQMNLISFSFSFYIPIMPLKPLICGKWSSLFFSNVSQTLSLWRQPSWP